MLLAPVSAPAFTILTQNIRMANPEVPADHPDHWPTRRPVLQDLLRRCGADVIGTQEVLPEQVPVIDEALGQTYLRLGYGRDGGGRGEHNLLLLRRDRFEVLDWDQFWLAEEPRLQGSLGWDAHCPRIAVLARVRDLATGREMIFAVTHLDHAGQQAQEQGAHLLAARLHEMAASGEGQGEGQLPIVLMGDFNADAEKSAAWRILVESGLGDTRLAAPTVHGGQWGTFPDYGEPTEGEARIDWILAEGLGVLEHSTHLHQLDGAVASDHMSVQARVQLAH